MAGWCWASEQGSRVHESARAVMSRSHVAMGHTVGTRGKRTMVAALCSRQGLGGPAVLNAGRGGIVGGGAGKCGGHATWSVLERTRPAQDGLGRFHGDFTGEGEDGIGKRCYGGIHAKRNPCRCRGWLLWTLLNCFGVRSMELSATAVKSGHTIGTSMSRRTLAYICIYLGFWTFGKKWYLFLISWF